MKIIIAFNRSRSYPLPSSKDFGQLSHEFFIAPGILSLIYPELPTHEY